MINMHNHSHNSRDAKDSIDLICKTAIKRNLKGIAFTDHASVYNLDKYNVYERIVNCKSETFKAKTDYEGKLKVLFGAEISEAHISFERQQEFLSIGNYDVIIASLHEAVPVESLGLDTHFRLNDFSLMPKEILIKSLKIYYNTLLEIARYADYDILAHLTYPFRYIICRDKVNFNIDEVIEDITLILKMIISRNKALEVNTSMANQNFFMPNRYIIELYKTLGGELITLGSDAHQANSVDQGLKEGINLLKECGFMKYYYYEKRKPISIKI